MRRLHLQLYLAILATLAVFVIAGATFWRLSTHWRADAWEMEAAAQFAGALLPPIEASTDRGQRALDGLRQHLNTDFALYDTAGNPIAVSGRIPPLTAEQLLGESGWVLARGGPLWIVPLDDGRRLVMRPPHHRAQHGRQMIVLLVAVALAFAIGTYPIARRLTGRLARLQEGVEQLGQGDLAARVRVEGRDEVAALARSFNDSASRI